MSPGVYRARRRGIRIHVRHLTPADRTLVEGLPVTSGAQTWLDLASVLPSEELVAIGDSLYRRAAIWTPHRSCERLDRADGTRGVTEGANACTDAHAAGRFEAGELDAVLADRRRRSPRRCLQVPGPRPVGTGRSPTVTSAIPSGRC